MRLDALLPIGVSAEQKYRPDTHDLEGKDWQVLARNCGVGFVHMSLPIFCLPPYLSGEVPVTVFVRPLDGRTSGRPNIGAGNRGAKSAQGAHKICGDCSRLH